MSVSKNSQKIYALTALQGALTVIPVFVPFVQAHGVTLEHVFWLQGLYTFGWVLADIPTGYLADVWSRRNTVILGSFFIVLMGAGFAFGDCFWHFALAELAGAIGMSCTRTSMQAIIYDELLGAGNTAAYRKVLSHQNTASWGSTAMSGIVGSWIAGYDMHAASLVMLLCFMLAFIISFTLHEPERHVANYANHLHAIKNIFIDTLVHNVPLRLIILVFSLTAALTFALVWFSQPYQTAVGIPMSYFGLLNAVFMAGLIGASHIARWLEKRVDDRVMLMVLVGSTMMAFFFMALPPSYAGLVIMFLARSTYGAMDPLTSDMVNRLVTSDRRATVLSIKTFLYNVFFTLIAPVAGYAAGALSVNGAIGMMGVLASLFIIPLGLLFKKEWKNLPA